MTFKIKKETLQTAYDAMLHVEENHRENVYCEIGNAANDIDQLNEHLKIVGEDSILGADIEWQILLLKGIKELSSIVTEYNTWETTNDK